MRDVPEAVNRERASGEQAEREAEFEHDERTTQAVTSRAGSGAAAFFQHVIQIHMCGLPRWSATKQHAGKQAGRDGEREHRKAEAHVRFGRQRIPAASWT